MDDNSMPSTSKASIKINKDDGSIDCAPHFKKQKLSAESLDEELELTSMVRPLTTIPGFSSSSCTDKIKGSRKSVPVKTSSRSGAGTAEIHVPKLWYYSEMLFLADVDSRSVNSIPDDMPFEDNPEVSNDESEDTVSTNVQSPLSQSSLTSSSRHQSRKTKAQADNILANIAKKMEEPNPPPRVKLQYDSLGEQIAEKFRNLPTTMATYCQKIINDAIFIAETNNLTIDSHIVHNHSQVFISQPNLNCDNSIILNNSLNRPGHSQITQNGQNDHHILYEAIVAAICETPETQNN